MKCFNKRMWVALLPALVVVMLALPASAVDEPPTFDEQAGPVCGLCITVTLYNFCVDSETQPPHREFGARLFNTATGTFEDQLMALDIAGKTLVYTTSFINLNVNQNYQVRLYADNQWKTDWTIEKSPPYGVIWNFGEVCLRNLVFAPLVSNGGGER